MRIDSDFEWLQTTQFADIPGISHGFAVGADSNVAPIDFGVNSMGRDVSSWLRVLQCLKPGTNLQQLAVMNQVHGGQCAVVKQPGGLRTVVGDVDGCVTTAPDIALVVRTADCCPILFANKHGIGVAHAGWRGVAANIVPETIQSLVNLTSSDASSIVAYVGPCISGDNYQVGEEVVTGIAATGVPHHCFVRNEFGALKVDIQAAVIEQLRLSGVTKVARVERCTFEDERLHSFRRNGANAGRMVGLILRSRPV